MLLQVIAFASGILAGAIVALKAIAPKTATTKDDEVLKLLERISELETALGLKPKA